MTNASSRRGSASHPGALDTAIRSLAQETLASRIVEALGEEILSGRLPPGTRVDLGHYAAKWEVSITPVRDAAKQLEGVGFLKVLPRRGVFVSELTAKEVADIFDVRIALETAAVRRATPLIPQAEAERALRLYLDAAEAPSEKARDRMLPKIDLLVHDLVLEHCDNPRLQKIMEGMRHLLRWCQRTICYKLDEPFLTTLPEHIAICRAICDRDAERAAAEMHGHLTRTHERVQAFLAGG